MTGLVTQSSLLADLVEARKGDLLRRWELRMQGAFTLGAVSRSELRDSLPWFLDALVMDLRGAKEPASAHSSDAVEPPSQSHGRQRFRIGFDIESVVREYGLLRDIILELMEEQGWPLIASELRRLSGFIDIGIAEAVGQHSRAREQALWEGDGRLPEDVQDARATRMEAERDEARERLQQVLTHLPLALWAFDRNGTVTLSEGQALASIGLRPGQMVGRSVHTLYADREDLHGYVRRALAGEAFTAEVDLGGVWFDVRFSPVLAPDGSVVSVTGLSVDISERHATEEAVRQSEMRYRLATLATSDVIWDWDFTTATIHWSENLYRVFGYGPGEMDTGLDWWSERLHPEDRERVGRDIQAAIDGTGSYWRDEYRLRRQDGTWAHVEDQGSLVRDVRGRAVRMVGAIHDVSERKAAEAEAQRRADFEQHLIGIVSHDLRNPISAIITSADNLMKRYGLDERQGRAIARILSSAERCNRMLRDMLDFTQARLGGGIPVVRKPMDLHLFARLVLDEVQLAWPQRRLERVQGGDAQGEWDADRLAQVLTNLVNNALSYSPEESPVRVETRGEAEAVVLSVHNAGPAIPPEQVPRLFQPMKRGERTGEKQGHGLGLGLFIVKHLVDAHGGTLEVRSAEGQGTTFTVRLPRRPSAQGGNGSKG
jgi:PAS domain S-box-containing protein